MSLALPLPSTLKARLGLFEWILGLVILPHDDLFLLFRYHMLHPHLFRMLLHEFPDESRVPKFRCYTQVFATSHQRV